MSVYRETYRLSRPPSMVANHLDERFERGSAASTWETRRFPYTVTFELRPEAGRLVRRVELAGPVRFGMVATLLVAVLALVAGASSSVHLAVLWLSAALVVVGVGHILPDVTPQVGADIGLETSRQRLGLVLVPALLSSVVSLTVVVHRAAESPLVAAVSVLVCLVGGTAYLTIASASDDSISAVGIPLSGFLAPVLVSSNVVLLAVAVRSAGRAAIPVVTLAAVGFTGLYLVYCDSVLDLYRESRVRPVTGWAGVLAGGAYALGCGLCLAVPVVFPVVADTRWWFGSVVATVGSVGGLPPTVATVGLLAVLSGPVLVMTLSWVGAVVGGLVSRPWLVRRGKSTSAAGETTVLTVESDRVFVRPVWWFGRYVVVSERVTAALTEDQLAAVVAHETAHLRPRERLVGQLATVVGVVPGGRNGILSFVDLPGTERAADDYAVETTGRRQLIGALRRLERLQAGEPQREERRGRELLLAPYRLFYGRVLLNGAHDKIGERIARLGDTAAEPADGVGP